MRVIVLYSHENVPITLNLRNRDIFLAKFSNLLILDLRKKGRNLGLEAQTNDTDRLTFKHPMYEGESRQHTVVVFPLLLRHLHAHPRAVFGDEILPPRLFILVACAVGELLLFALFFRQAESWNASSSCYSIAYTIAAVQAATVGIEIDCLTPSITMSEFIS